MDPVMVLSGLAAGVGVVALVLGTKRFFPTQRDEVVDRLQRRTGALPLAAAGGGGPRVGAALARGLRPLARAVQGREEEVSKVRRALGRAGFRSPYAIEIFLAVKVLAALATPMLFLLYNARTAEPVQAAGAIAMVTCAAGFYLPTLWLSAKISRRKTDIERALPEAMDLLVTCVEAGLGIDAALGRVADETALAAPILAEEFQLTFLEIQAGIGRADGFRRMADRTGVEDLKALTATLIQTEMFGTSIARALRVHADGIRVRRMQRAEEKAAMVAVKMTVPLILCILPSLIAVVMGPAIVNISRALLPGLRGGGR